MSSTSEKGLIVATCVITAAISAGFSLSQGDVKSGKNKNTYISQAATNEEENATELYKIVSAIEDDGEVVVEAYQNEELDDEGIISLLEDIKKENDNLSDNYKVNLYKDKTSYDNNKEAQFVIKIDNQKAYVTTTYKDVEHDIIDNPEYELISSEDVDDEDNYGSLKTMIYVIMDENDSKETALTNVKSVGNAMRSLINTEDILNIIAYTSDDKDEYWEYNGHNKENIIHGRILEIN